MKKIGILYIIDSLSVGGAEKLVLTLANNIDHTRFDVYVCCLKVLRGNALANDFTELGAPIRVFNHKYLYDPRILLGIARFIRKHGIDIVHTHLIYSDIVGRIAGSIMGRPVISTLHSVPQGYNAQRIDRRLLGRLTARYLTQMVVPVAARVGELFNQEWGIPRDRIRPIYPGIRVEDYIDIPARRSQQEDYTGPVISTVGRLSPEKAQHRLIEAAKIVLDQYPNARFMIVGQGHLHSQLVAQAEALGIADQVTFTGVRHDIPNVLAESDIFVLSSLWEGLPVSAIEAMAAACPVVLTDVGSTRELAKPGVHGLIVPPDDVQALANALMELLKDEDRRVAMGLAGRERVQQEFSNTALVRQHEALYEQVFHKHRSAVPKLFLSTRR